MRFPWMAGWVFVVCLTFAVGGCGAFRRPAVAPAPPEPTPPVEAAEEPTTETLALAPPPVVPETDSPRRHLPTPPDPARRDTVAVVLDVNGLRVTLEEYREGLREFLLARGIAEPTPELEERYRRLLVEELLLYDYGRRMGIDREREFRRRAQRLQSQLLIDYVRRAEVLDRVQVPEAELRAFYEEYAVDYATPRMVQVRTIQTSTYRDAERVHEQLRIDPTLFANLARQYSIHPSRARAGEMDPFPRDTYARPFEDVAFDLEIGEISPIIATEQGYFLLEKLGEIPEQRPSFEELRPVVEERLRVQRENEAMREFLEKLRQYGTVDARWPAPTVSETEAPPAAAALPAEDAFENETFLD